MVDSGVHVKMENIARSIAWSYLKELVDNGVHVKMENIAVNSSWVLTIISSGQCSHS